MRRYRLYVTELFEFKRVIESMNDAWIEFSSEILFRRYTISVTKCALRIRKCVLKICRIFILVSSISCCSCETRTEYGSASVNTTIGIKSWFCRSKCVTFTMFVNKTFSNTWDTRRATESIFTVWSRIDLRGYSNRMRARKESNCGCWSRLNRSK